jgi:hypothetical protein
MDSPDVSRQWDHPTNTTGPMKRQRLNRLSHAESDELNRQLKYAVGADLRRPSRSEFGSPIYLCVSLMARCDCALTTGDLTRLRVKTLTHFRVWRTHSMSLRAQIFTLISTSRLASGKFKFISTCVHMCPLAVLWRDM